MRPLKRPLSPLARAALAVCVGAIAAFRTPPSAPVLLLLAILLAAATYTLLRRRPAVPLVLALGAAGFALGRAAVAANRADCRVGLPDGARVAVRGAFESTVVPGESAPFGLEAVRWAGGAGKQAGSARCNGSVRARAPFGWAPPRAARHGRARGDGGRGAGSREGREDGGRAAGEDGGSETGDSEAGGGGDRDAGVGGGSDADADGGLGPGGGGDRDAGADGGLGPGGSGSREGGDDRRPDGGGPAETARDPDRSEEQSGPGAATLPASIALPAGAELVGWGRWWTYPPQGPWPREPEWAGRLALDSVRVLAPGGVDHHPMLAARGAAQARIRALFAGRGSERAAIAEALLLAERGGLDPALRERFARSGLTHLLAISGLHVGLIAATLLLLGRVLRLSPRLGALAAGAATVGYVVFLGAPHAAARAALQVLLVLAARLMQRPADPFAILAAAALVLVALDPLALLAPGFQLSFAGTAGILALRGRLLAAWPMQRARVLRDAIATSLAATLATAPIAALHFGRVAPIGIVANLAAIPLVAAAVPALALALALSFVSMPVGRFVAGAADLLLAGLDTVAAAAAAVPGGHVYVTRDAVGGWVAAAALAALITGQLARSSAARARDRARGRPNAAARSSANVGIRRTVRRGVAAAAALALLIAWPVVVGGAGDGALEIHAIDVGQGDAFAIRTPDGRWLLVDAGPRTDDWDAGRARVVPFLLRHGARRLEALLLTHPDADHIGGAAAVLEAFDVGAVIDPGVPTGKPLYLSLLERALEQDIRWLAGRAGREIRLGDVVLRFLHPAGHALDARAEANQFSLVFLLRYGRFRALFLGDVPAAVERMLVERHGARLRAQVLKVAHHGSTTSTAEALLAGVGPDVALISAGRHNRYGHPAPAVLERLRRHGVRIYRTDRQGSITLRVDAAGRLEVQTTR